MSRRSAVLHALCLALLFGPRATRADQVTLSAASLKDPLQGQGVSARAWGLGGAYVGVADAPDTLYWNPAGLANLSEPGLSLDHNSFFAGASQDTVSLDLPLTRSQTLGLGVDYVNFGGFTDRDAQGNPLGSVNAYDLQAKLGDALQIGSGLSFGASLSLLSENLDNAPQSSEALDLGLTWDAAPGLRAGLSLMQLGLGGSNAADSAQVRVGASFRPGAGALDATLFSVAVEADGGGFEAVQAGAETLLYSTLALRAGYQWIPQTQVQLDALDGLSLGLGFKFGDLGLDYAYLPFGYLGDSQRLSLDWRFVPSQVASAVADGGQAVGSYLGRVQDAGSEVGTALTGLLLGETGTAGSLGGAAYVGAAYGLSAFTGYDPSAVRQSYAQAGMASQAPAAQDPSFDVWGGYQFPFGLVLELGTQVNPSRQFNFSSSGAGVHITGSSTDGDVYIYETTGYRWLAGRASVLTLGLREGMDLLSQSQQETESAFGTTSTASASASGVGFAFGPVLRWDRILGSSASFGLELGYDYELDPSLTGQGSSGGSGALDYSGFYTRLTLAGWFGHPLAVDAAPELPGLPALPAADLSSPPPLPPSAAPVDQAPASPPGDLQLKFQLPESPLAEAEALQSQGRTREALDLFLKVLHDDNANLAAWRDLADLYVGLGRRDYAAQCFEQVLRLQPGDPKAEQWLEAYKAHP
jgi:hypothetical protein